jgi:hypothetical protein
MQDCMAGDIRQYERPSRRHIYWLDRHDGDVSLCVLRPHHYGPCVRLTAPDQLHGAVPSALADAFRTNALAERGIRELTISSAEARQPEVVREIGRYFASAIRSKGDGDHDRPPVPALFRDEKSFPDYAWSPEASREYAAYMKRVEFWKQTELARGERLANALRRDGIMLPVPPAATPAEPTNGIAKNDGQGGANA